MKTPLLLILHQCLSNLVIGSIFLLRFLNFSVSSVETALPERDMRKHRIRDSIKSLFESHVDREKHEELKGTRSGEFLIKTIHHSLRSLRFLEIQRVESRRDNL